MTEDNRIVEADDEDEGLPPIPRMCVGSSGSFARFVNTMLIARAMAQGNKKHGIQPGICYGDPSAELVRNFQFAFHIPASGDLDEITREALGGAMGIDMVEEFTAMMGDGIHFIKSTRFVQPDGSAILWPPPPVSRDLEEDGGSDDEPGANDPGSLAD